MMSLANRARLFYSFRQPPKNLLAIHSLATVKAFDAMQQMRLKLFARRRDIPVARLLILLQPPQAGADHFTGGLVKPAIDFGLHKLFQLWRQRHIHRFGNGT